MARAIMGRRRPATSPGAHSGQGQGAASQTHPNSLRFRGVCALRLRCEPVLSPRGWWPGPRI
eukprot:10912093-Alexandrium_andersonii.AAC.1